MLAPGFFGAALLLRGNTLLAGSLDQGIAAISLGARPRPAQAHAEGPEGATRKLADWDGRILALTADGLYAARATGSRWDSLIHRDPGTLTDANLSALAIDRAGRLWAGYFDRGLDIVEDGRVRHLENDSLFCVNRIVPSPDGETVAVATANGLVLFDSGGRRRNVLRRGQGLIADHECWTPGPRAPTPRNPRWPFFSSDLASLSDVFARVGEVEVEIRDAGSGLREQVLYPMR